MRHIVIGTAGHVDHGKTCLTRALTGVDTDRLAEEKRRGLTIEPGFAPLTLPGGQQASVIDVPGHERFIRNMLVGAGGMDVVLLVVAADEGFMPQTWEHLAILQLLGVQNGIVVLTKADLVEPEWLALAEEEARTEVAGTFLEGAPVLAVSARTGQGMGALLALVCELVERACPKEQGKPFRLPVDRVFTVEGFGTVVTGTLTEGTLTVGEVGELPPGGGGFRVRGLQVHDSPVAAARAGQRVAVNLAGVPRRALARGDVLAAPGTVAATTLADARLTLAPGAPYEVKSGSRLHLHHGTAETVCRATLLDTALLRPGQSSFAQLRFEKPLCARNGDRFVLRFFSPLATVGGGILLDCTPPRRRRHNVADLEALRRLAGEDGERLCQALALFGASMPAVEAVALRAALAPASAAAALDALAAAGHALTAEGRYMEREVFDSLARRAQAMLKAWHAANPAKPGMGRGEFVRRLLPGVAAAAPVMGLLEGAGVIRAEGPAVALPGFAPAVDEAAHKWQEQMERFYLEAGAAAPTDAEAAARLGGRREELRLPGERLTRAGVLITLAPGVRVHRKGYGQAMAVLARLLSEQPTGFTLARFRDEMGLSRKYALYLLEHWDTCHITKKQGDVRVRGERFAL